MTNNTLDREALVEQVIHEIFNDEANVEYGVQLKRTVAGDLINLILESDYAKDLIESNYEKKVAEAVEDALKNKTSVSFWCNNTYNIDTEPAIEAIKQVRKC